MPKSLTIPPVFIEYVLLNQNYAKSIQKIHKMYIYFIGQITYKIFERAPAQASARRASRVHTIKINLHN